MKVILSGVFHRRGNAKKTGLPFDFKQVDVLQPLKKVSSANYSVSGVGNETVTFQADDSLDITPFEAFRYPAIADVEFRPEMQGRVTTLVVTGIQNIKSLVA